MDGDVCIFSSKRSYEWMPTLRLAHLPILSGDTTPSRSTGQTTKAGLMVVSSLITPPARCPHALPCHNGDRPPSLTDWRNITGSMTSYHLLDLHETWDVHQEVEEVFPESLPVWPVKRAWEIVWACEIMERSCQPWFHGRILLFLKHLMDQSLQMEARWEYGKITKSLPF